MWFLPDEFIEKGFAHVGEVEGREGGKVLKRRFRMGQIHPNRRSIDIRGALLVTVGAGY